MAYRIDPTLPTSAELRRVLHEQLSRSVTLLRAAEGPDPEAIHDVRKRIKKSRSLVRLARGDLGRAVARHANDELRAVGAALAEQRDADSLVEAIDRLHAVPATTGETDALTATRDLLAARADRLRGTSSTPAVARSGARTLEQLIDWTDHLPARMEGWDALAPGFGRSYAHGRAAYLDLPVDPTVLQLHELRKRVKDLWYHQRLLRGLWPDAQRPLTAAAERLAALLGDDHDLGLLAGLLVPPDDGEPGIELAGEDLEVVRAVVARERLRLQVQARRVAALLYADEPRAWVDRHRAWWDAVDRTSPPPPEEGPVRVGLGARRCRC